MAAVVVQHESQDVRVPAWVGDLDTFRQWAMSDDFPTRGWYAYLAGEIWADPSMERAAHNAIKTEIARVVGNLVLDAKSGRFFSDRMLLTNRKADLSTEPDGMFLSYETIKLARALLKEGDDALEVTGSPDLVVEVISPSSRRKDTVVLRDLYFKAGVTEYWLAEQGRTDLTFQILRLTTSGFVEAPVDGGWVHSDLLGQWFQLTGNADPTGVTNYTLLIRV